MVDDNASQSPLIAQRIIAKDVTAEELQRERVRLLSKFKLRPMVFFDSCEKTGGQKDVIGCETGEGRRVILRIGERRPEWFFSDGFIGETLRVPRQFHAGGTRMPYEIEEWVDGKMICDGEGEWSRCGQLSSAAQDRLLAVFWEFQKISASLPLEPLYGVDRLRTFYKEAGDLVPNEAARLIDAHEPFWNGAYPAKWKFATDNLIVDADGKVALIDNVKVGARYFIYDLGTLIWPRWVEMETAAFSNIERQLEYLDAFNRKFLDGVPSDVAVPDNVDIAFDLMLFERLIGSLYDVKRQVRHFADWGMMGETGASRRAAHTKFLQELLLEIIQRLPG